MKKRTNVLWSTLLSLVMVFLLVAQPHAGHAADDDTTDFEQESIVEQKTGALGADVTTDTTPEGVLEPEVLPLLAPVAAAVFSSTVINSIFAAALGFYVGYEAQFLFKESVNDKHYASTAQYPITETPEYNNKFPEYIETILVQNSATKHMNKEAVLEVHNRIKNFSNDSNYRMYKSTRYPDQTMYVIDLVSPLNATVNRHLGNYLSGSRFTNGEDPSYKNETLNLAGYSIFIITEGKRIFHASFTPTYLRDREIEYNRYRGEFNTQHWPSYSRNDKYLQSGNVNWDSEKKSAMYNRGLLRDSKNYRSVVPYK